MATITRATGEQPSKDPIIEEILTKVTDETSVRRYSKGAFLGKGGFARVYEIVSLDTQQSYAGKVIAKLTLTHSRAKQKLMSEIRIYRSLRHEHIVEFEHFFEDSENVYILLELCRNQTLSDLLRRRKRLTELEAKCYLSQISSALLYAHSKCVIHCDLKIGNLFLNEKMQIKLGDFGLTSKLEYKGQKRKNGCGTQNYIALEVLDGKCGHSYEADVWSLGVVMYTLLVGRPPFETNDVKKTYNLTRMNAYSFPEYVGLSEEAESLITRILKNDPAKRPTLNEILKHEFFHMGSSIPNLLPVSTLAVPPSQKYIAQFRPKNKNAPSLHKTETMLVNLKSLKPTDSSRKFLLTQRPKTRTSEKKLSARKMASQRTELEVHSSVWVKKWVDYSSKYGLGYILSNGCAGVCFNDSTKLAVEPYSSSFTYIERANSQPETLTHFKFEEYPKQLYKKVTLLQHFRSYLGTELTTLNCVERSSPLIYVKKWMRTKRAILFRLSNKVV